MTNHKTTGHRDDVLPDLFEFKGGGTLSLAWLADSGEVVHRFARGVDMQVLVSGAATVSPATVGHVSSAAPNPVPAMTTVVLFEQAVQRVAPRTREAAQPAPWFRDKVMEQFPALNIAQKANIKRRLDGLCEQGLLSRALVHDKQHRAEYWFDAANSPAAVLPLAVATKPRARRVMKKPPIHYSWERKQAVFRALHETLPTTLSSPPITLKEVRDRVARFDPTFSNLDAGTLNGWLLVLSRAGWVVRIEGRPPHRPNLFGCDPGGKRWDDLLNGPEPRDWIAARAQFNAQRRKEVA